jgi:hypothetical protein
VTPPAYALALEGRPGDLESSIVHVEACDTNSATPMTHTSGLPGTDTEVAVMSERASRPKWDSDLELPLLGRTVSRCCLDFALAIHFLSEGDDTALGIGGPFSLWLGKAQWNMSPTSIPEVGNALQIMGQRVDRAMALASGELELDFANGLQLRVPPDPDYEAWDLVGASGLRVVSLPGGGLAVWEPPGA